MKMSAIEGGRIIPKWEDRVLLEKTPQEKCNRLINEIHMF